MSDTTTPAQVTPLWSDEALAALYMPTEDEHGYLVHPSIMFMLINVRASYEAERVRLIAELAESQRYALQLERALGEAWTPVPDGEYHPGGGNRVLAYPLVVSHNEVDNRMTLIMCGPHGVLLDDGWRLMRRRTSSPTAGEEGDNAA
jgi:hypothetical protein